MDRDVIIKEIRCCITTATGRLSLTQLDKDYKSLMGESIPYQKLGFKRLKDLIESSPDLNLTKDDNEFYVTAKISQKSAHISELVARQKKPKRKPAKMGRYTRAPIAPRMQQTSKWRPKTNFQTSKYQSPSRPQAVSHSQFVDRPRPGNPPNYYNQAPAGQPHAQSVSSKVVVPEYSTYTSKPSQPSVPVAPTTMKRPNMNQRLTSHRVTENMKALENNNNIPNDHDTTKINEVTSSSSGNSLNNLIQEKPKLVQTDPLLASTRKRLNKKISELNLERDSGNSSPTNDILCSPLPIKTPDFVRTKDPLADLKYFAELHKLGVVTVDVAPMIQKKKHERFYSCKIKVGQKYTYSSYPNDFNNRLEAQSFCCEQALADLIPKCKRKSLMISSETDILTRIPPLLEKHQHGIWAWQLKLDYVDKYSEQLSDDWLKIIDSSPCVQIEKMSEDYILYHCRPGDVLQKGQQRVLSGAVPLSNVSVPANTVQFGDDNKLTGQVTSVVSANEIWCEQIETIESNMFIKMFEMMQIYYQEHEAQLVPETILPAGYYIAKYEGLYHRIRAVKINDDDVNCFFIDYGDETAVSKTDIFVLKREYATSQAQAFVCRLFGLEDLYDASTNSQALLNLYEKPVVLELALDVTSEDLVLPVFMYDFDTGNCINEELIPKLTMELATPFIPPDGVTEVYISNIESNADIYVQVRTRGYKNLEDLRKQLEEKVTVNPPREILYKITKANSKDKLYFMKHNVTGTWYRVKLIDWCPVEAYAQVYFIDEGHTDVVKVAEETLYPLEALNDVFDKYPAQAVRVRMFLNTIPSNFVDLAGKAKLKENSVLLKIVGCTPDNIPLVKLFKRNDDDGLFCINESVALESELSSRNETLKNKLKITQHGGIGHVPSTGSLKCPPLPKIGNQADEYFKVFVSVAVSPYNFFVQPFDSKHQLDQLMDKLQQRYSGVQYGNLKVEDVMPGSIYASKHDDGFWYRTSVIKVINSGSSVSVFYCDFGYYQTLPVKHLVPLDDMFMELPYQALKAKMSGIKPKQNKWTVEDCEQFKERIENKLLFAKLTNIEKDVLYESDLVLKLLLVDTSTDSDVIVSQELIQRGIAVVGD